MVWYTNHNNGVSYINTDDWGSAESGYKIPDHDLGKFEYKELHAYALRSRDVYGKGKYINTWLRLKLNSNEEPEIWVNGDKFMSVSKDNIATVHMDTGHIWRSSGTYVIALNRWIPFTIERHRTGIYRIAHNLNIYKHLEKTWDKDKYYWHEISAFMRQSQVVCDGLKYNLLTGELLNPNTDHEPQRCVENIDKRKVWRKKITAFKKQLRTRARLGLIDSTLDKLKSVDRGKFIDMVETHAKLLGEYDDRISEAIYAIRKDTSSNYNIIDLIDTRWDTPESIKFLAKHIDENTMTSEIFMPICLALDSISWHRNWRNQNDIDRDKDINTFFNQLSIHLRRHYGVIEKEATIKQGGELHKFSKRQGHYNSLPMGIKQVHNAFKGVLEEKNK
tara:strand:- start:81 stop:1250 length:1170 start_codon:yes stop_codon:yes gene_type:complete